MDGLATSEESQSRDRDRGCSGKPSPAVRPTECERRSRLSNGVQGSQDLGWDRHAFQGAVGTEFGGELPKLGVRGKGAFDGRGIPVVDGAVNPCGQQV